MAHNEPKPIFVLCQSVYRVGSKLDTRTTGNANPTRTHHQEYTALKRLSPVNGKYPCEIIFMFFSVECAGCSGSSSLPEQKV
jgi:hypothetical protein